MKHIGTCVPVGAKFTGEVLLHKIKTLIYGIEDVFWGGRRWKEASHLFESEYGYYGGLHISSLMEIWK